MRLAYADPPYPGKARKHYRDDPSGIPAAEVDYPALIEQLRTYDGWALSTLSTALYLLLPMAPEARIGAWVKPFCVWRPTHRVQYAWEPVLFAEARPRGAGRKRGDGEYPADAPRSIRDWVTANMTTRKGTHGAKPDAFCDWLGTGAIGQAWNRLLAHSPSAPVPQGSLWGEEDLRT